MKYFKVLSKYFIEVLLKFTLSSSIIYFIYENKYLFIHL